VFIKRHVTLCRDGHLDGVCICRVTSPCHLYQFFKALKLLLLKELFDLFGDIGDQIMLEEIVHVNFRLSLELLILHCVCEGAKALFIGLFEVHYADELPIAMGKGLRTETH
jgi:hypothetical protein